MDYYTKLQYMHSIIFFVFLHSKCLQELSYLKMSLKRNLNMSNFKSKKVSLLGKSIYTCIILHICDFLSINPPHSQNFRKLFYWFSHIIDNKWFASSVVLVSSGVQHNSVIGPLIFYCKLMTIRKSPGLFWQCLCWWYSPVEGSSLAKWLTVHLWAIFAGSFVWTYLWPDFGKSVLMSHFTFQIFTTKIRNGDFQSSQKWLKFVVHTLNYQKNIGNTVKSATVLLMWSQLIV